MPDNTRKEETTRWLRYAQDDLASAELLLASNSAPPRHACLFAQQAAEKAIKCILVFLEMPVPKTHDLGFLQRCLPNGMRAYLLPENELDNLSFWAVESRYPGEETEAESRDAEVAIATAHRVLDAVEADLAAAGFVRP